jgi:hypothetical protein
VSTFRENQKLDFNWNNTKEDSIEITPFDLISLEWENNILVERGVAEEATS